MLIYILHIIGFSILNSSAASAVVVAAKRDIRDARLGQVVLHQFGLIFLHHELLPLCNHEFPQDAPLVAVARLQVGHFGAAALFSHHCATTATAAFHPVVMRYDVVVLLLH